jgi:hypothetical protein
MSFYVLDTIFCHVVRCQGYVRPRIVVAVIEFHIVLRLMAMENLPIAIELNAGSTYVFS